MRLQLFHTADFEIKPEDLANLFGFLFVEDQVAVFEVVAERDHPAHPHAFPLRGGNLVPDTLSGHFPFKLGKGEKNIQRQPSH